MQSYFVAKLFKIIYDFILWPILQYLSHWYSPRFEGPCYFSPRHESNIIYTNNMATSNAIQKVDKQLLLQFNYYFTLITLGGS